MPRLLESEARTAWGLGPRLPHQHFVAKKPKPVSQALADNGKGYYDQYLQYQKAAQYTRMYIRIYIFIIYTYMHACMHPCMHAGRQAGRQAGMHACMHTYRLIFTLVLAFI